MKQQLGLPIRASNIAVVKALRGLGDMLVGVPGLRTLRAHYPDAHIALIGLPWTREVFARTGPYVDEVVEFVGWPGIVDTPFDAARIPRFLARLQARRFDLAIQMHGSGVASNPLTACIGARTAAGYYLPANYRPEGLFLPYRADLAQPVLWVNLLEQLGAEPQGYGLEFKLLPEDVLGRDLLLAEAGTRPHEYAIVHPGADRAVRRWDARYFAEVARHLVGEGLRVLVTGTRAERELAQAVVQQAGAADGAVVSVAGQTSIGGLGALVDGALLLVANDTGVSHLAAARRTPSVVVYMPICERHLWAPLDTRLHRPVYPPSLAAVLEEADSLLSLGRAPALDPEVLRYAM